MRQNLLGKVQAENLFSFFRLTYIYLYIIIILIILLGACYVRIAHTVQMLAIHQNVICQILSFIWHSRMAKFSFQHFVFLPTQ